MKSPQTSKLKEQSLNILALALLIYSIYGFFVFFDGITQEEGPAVFRRYFWKWHYALVLAIAANLAAIGLYVRRSFGWIVGLPICITTVIEGIRLLGLTGLETGLHALNWAWFILIGLALLFLASSVLLLLKSSRLVFNIRGVDFIFSLLILVVLIIKHPFLSAFLFPTP